MKEFNLYLDIYETLANSIMKFTQFDTGGVFYLYLTEKQQPIDLTNCSVEIKLVKSDGTPLIQECEITRAELGQAKIRIHDQACSLDGIAKGIVDIYDAQGDKTATQQFSFFVDEYLKDNGDIENQEEYPVLQSNIRQLQAMRADVNDKIVVYDEIINEYARETKALQTEIKELRELVELMLQ